MVTDKNSETYPILLSVLFTFTRPSNILNTEHENSSVGTSFSEGIEGKGTELSVMRSEVERSNEKSAREPPTREIDPEVVRAGTVWHGLRWSMIVIDIFAVKLW